MKEEIIVVDELDNAIGSIEKMEAHRMGVLHRAFSIFIFNSNNQLLLQKRSESKYHSPGLWTNTCCSHPRKGENLQEAIHRRLQEEMGFTCKLYELFAFIYKVELQDDLYENEYDHVFVGTYDGNVHANIEEVQDYKWIEISNIKLEIKNHPEYYTYWFKYIIDRVEAEMKKQR